MPAGINAILDAERKAHDKSDKAFRWCRVAGERSDVNINLLKNIGWEPVAGAKQIGDVALFETTLDNYENRQKDKARKAAEFVSRGRESAAMELDKEARKHEGVWPIGSDGAGVDFDKKHQVKGTKVPIVKDEED